MGRRRCSFKGKKRVDLFDCVKAVGEDVGKFVVVATFLIEKV